MCGRGVRMAKHNLRGETRNKTSQLYYVWEGQIPTKLRSASRADSFKFQIIQGLRAESVESRPATTTTTTTGDIKAMSYCGELMLTKTHESTPPPPAGNIVFQSATESEAVRLWRIWHLVGSTCTDVVVFRIDKEIPDSRPRKGGASEMHRALPLQDR